jgi:glycosyl-4,4'-diaponeurosporenoate acyltransferase
VWTIAANFIGWPLFQLAIARIYISLPGHIFDKKLSKFAPHKNEIIFYQKRLRIKKWKHRLPDGGSWVGDTFSKRRLVSRDQHYLNQFILETRRGEATHWTAIACCPIFFIWNPTIAWPIIIAVALALNLPCIITQRYNKFVLLNLLASKVI